jgi:hypothetical protein
MVPGSLLQVWDTGTSTSTLCFFRRRVSPELELCFVCHHFLHNNEEKPTTAFSASRISYFCVDSFSIELPIQDAETMIFAPSRWNTDQTKLIHAPIEVIWDTLIDFDQWESWTTSLADAKHYLVEINETQHVFKWAARFGLRCKSIHTITLSKVDSTAVMLRHTEEFKGLFCKELNNINFCFNEGLKNHVESLHFNQLMSSMSARTKKSSDPFSDSDSARSSCTQTMSFSESSSKTLSYWDTPKHLRKEISKKYIFSPE